MQLLLGVVLLAAILVVAVVVLAGAIALLRRDRDKLHGSGSLGTAMQELESLFTESKRHVIKVERAEEAEEGSASGDPPEK